MDKKRGQYEFGSEKKLDNNTYKTTRKKIKSRDLFEITA